MPHDIEETELLIPNSQIELIEKERSSTCRSKLLALTAALLFSIGSHYATNNFGALKGSIQKELDISNTSYGIAQSAVYLMNTVLPLFGGILMDYFGSAPGALLSNSFILLGNLLIALSFSLKTHYSFDLVLIGRVLHGFGSGMIVVAQEIILSKWFSNSDMATVIGLQIGMSRFANLVAQASANFIAELTGSIEGPMWVSVCVCFLSWISTLLYVRVIRPIEKSSTKAPKSSRFSPLRLLYLPLGFWILPFTAMFLDGVWTPFFGSATDYIKRTYLSKSNSIVFEDVEAGWISSIGFILPIFLSPVMGILIDKKGYRSVVVVCSAVLTAAAFAILAWDMELLYLGLVIFSISHTIGPVALTSSIPLILPKELIGTGIGTHKVGMSLGITFLHLISGMTQDSTPNKKYSRVILQLLFVSIFGIFMSIIYCIYNKKYLSGIFDAPSKLRRRIMRENSDEFMVNKPLSSIGPSSICQRLMMCFFLVLIFLSWTFFILVAIMNKGIHMHFP